MCVLVDTILIPLEGLVLAELEDCFADTVDMDARKFIYNKIKAFCRDAKACLRTKNIQVIQKDLDGKYKHISYPINNLDLGRYAVSHNPEWLPLGVDAENCEKVTLKLGDKTMSYLQSYARIVLIRNEQFMNTENTYTQNKINEMESLNTSATVIEQFKASRVVDKEKLIKEMPSCLEQILHANIIVDIEKKLQDNDKDLFDKEDDEINKAPEPKPE